MNIIVTGGTGFIGSYICKLLVKQGHYVICIDNNFTGSLNNIKELLELPNFHFINHNIIEPIYFNDIIINQIYHLACPASPKAYQSDPIYTIKTNVFGTLNMLGIAKKHNSTILLSSTSEIYGDPNITPQNEEYWGNVNPIGYRSCYDEGKRIAETLTMEYYRTHNINIRIARIFNTYGPYMNKDDGRVVSNFINQCITNKDITIYGNGSQTRSFCYIDDTIDALIKLMNQKLTIGPINIGNPYEITIKELVNIIVSLIPNTKSKITFSELPSDDPKKRKPCIDKANQYLSWQPTTNLNDGLIKTINYFTSFNNIKSI
jgi:UDP-glucuronate decarboxylase